MENPTPQEQVKTCDFGSDHVTIEYMQNAVKWRSERTHDNNRDSVLQAIKSMARESVLDRDTALTVFNTIADNAGWDTVDSIATTYTVTVTLFGQTIGEFTDVEADSDDEAVSLVEGGADISLANLSVSVDFNGESLDDTIDLTGSWHFDLNDYIEFEAVED